MQLSSEITLSDIAACISVFLIAIGGCFTYFQWRKNNLLKRADSINALIEKIRSDKKIQKTLSLFDYETSWYNLEFHGSGELESDVDETLSCFSYICYLKKMKIISDKEFAFFRYNTTRLLRNK